MNNLEKGKKFLFQIPSIDFKVELPLIEIPGEKKSMVIASLNLVGMIEWNNVLGKAIAKKIRENITNLNGVVLFTAVEKALQLSQVVASELDIKQIAVAYNRIKPHMNAKNRPPIQASTDSITSGEKYLVVYERDINLLALANGVIILDDVVSFGSTVATLASMLDQIRDKFNLSPESLKILGIYCVATEGKQKYKMVSATHALGELPPPEFIR